MAQEIKDSSKKSLDPSVQVQDISEVPVAEGLDFSGTSLPTIVNNEIKLIPMSAIEQTMNDSAANSVDSKFDNAIVEIGDDGEVTLTI